MDGFNLLYRCEEDVINLWESTIFNYNYIKVGCRFLKRERRINLGANMCFFLYIYGEGTFIKKTIARNVNAFGVVKKNELI